MITLTYDSTLSRVAIDVNALAAADIATIERSTDLVRWTTVRGATALPVTAGALDRFYDYEWKPSVVNHYRVRGIELGPIEYVGAGTPATGNNASVTPALPAGLVDGDLMVIFASIRNSGTGTVNVPAGWTPLNLWGNTALLARRYVTGDVAPTVTFAGGVANADTIGHVAAWRRAHLDLDPVYLHQLNASAQNIAFPFLTIDDINQLVLIAGWKQDDWSSVATLPLTGNLVPLTGGEVGEAVSTAGDDAGQVWDYILYAVGDGGVIDQGSFVVTGGAAAISRSIILVVPHAPWLNEQTAAFTPTMTQVWLKSPQRPFLNVPIVLGGKDFEVERASRGSSFDILDRSLPVAVGQPQGSRRYELNIRTETDQAAQTLEYLLASGDVLFLHAPANKVVPAGGVYVRVDRTNLRLLHVAGTKRRWTIPVLEAAPPGPDVAYALSTWATVLALYATFTDLLAANPTWDDLLQLIADPSEVIVS